VATTAYPLTVTDGLGRSLTLAVPPTRIVSIAPSNTEILFAVDAGEQVVGVTKYCNYPEEAQKREQVGGFSAKTISVEKIVALKPDLVITGDESHQPVIDALVQLNIPVMALKASTFEDVYRNIELVGHVTDHGVQASEVVAQMRARVDVVTEKVAAIPQAERVSVFWEVFDEPLMTAGPSTFIGQMIELAGGVNVFADVTEEYPEISTEEIVRRDPSVILGPDSHSDKLTPELIGQRPGWETIAATKSGRIVVINGDIASRAGPRLPEALEAVGKALYPEVFK
jgi:iron complex transport system substrate-binding protein